MKNKFPAEILSLDESDLFTHRRSKSSSQFNSFNSPNETRKKYYLIEKRNENMNKINITNKSVNDTKMKEKEIQEIQEIDLTPNSTQKFSVHAKRKRNSSHNSDVDEILDKEESFNFSMYSHTNSHNPNNKLLQHQSVDYEKYKNLKEKYIKIKSKYQNSQNCEKHWRHSYFTLLKETLNFDETIRNLMEENRIHQEYIISLENKLNKLFATCNSITANFHNSLSKNMLSNWNNMNSNTDLSFENTNTNVNNGSISQAFLKNYNEVLNDYKKQLEILAEEKESLNTNLSISRHQHLQTTIKMENLQTRVFTLEQARMEDLKVIENLAR